MVGPVINLAIRGRLCMISAMGEAARSEPLWFRPGGCPGRAGYAKIPRFASYRRWLCDAGMRWDRFAWFRQRNEGLDWESDVHPTC